MAAVAGFVRALSLWLVFPAFIVAFAALVSTEARGWLTAKAKRAGTLIAGAETGPPGFFYLEAPQVYTRECLVDDRFTQANWLRSQLERTGREGCVDSFSGHSAASEEIQHLALTLRAAGIAAPKAQSEGRAQANAPAPGDVLLDRPEDFERQSALENPTDPKEDPALDWFMRTPPPGPGRTPGQAG